MAIEVERQSTMSRDELGDRMKQFEAVGTSARAERGLPIVIRLDGRSFSSFTSGLPRPYDARLSRLMFEVMRECARETNALIGYTQSDEISLVLHAEDPTSQLYFDGRFQKIVSVLAGVASVEFNSLLPEAIPERSSRRALFDCRAWTVPSLEEAANAILWRELDAIKNSVSMLAGAHFSPKQLHGRGQSDRLSMLSNEGVEWDSYPTFFKRGWYVRRVIKRSKFTVDELESLPPKHAARMNPDLEIERSVFQRWSPPPLVTIKNRVEALFKGAEVVT